jgi:glycosyltransferase involved in cell wall biosynthesis
MQATVVITTKNRREDLARAVASAVGQTAHPEVLVMDDGSTDGTAEAVASEFPSVRLHRSETSLGYIAQRNRAARLASNPIIFSMDDDAAYSTPGVVEATLREFSHPRVGAVAMPFVEVNRSPAVLHRAPEPSGVYARYDFIGTAHALRRDLFLRLCGYREVLVHQSEEEDYCIRLLNAGYVTRAGNAEPVHHFESPRRSWKRMDYYGARNKILYAWHNVPLSRLPGRLAGMTVKAASYTLRPDRVVTRVRGLLAGYALAFGGRLHREAVPPGVYELSQELKRRGPMRIEDLEGRLPLRAPGDAVPAEFEKNAAARA